ncbi:MAG TPA: chromate transporter [Candidatus Eisenbergiella merdavium]|uniref:Chromate transporter n=1 Tax=Candidatus Eisenbergiella merdavium TaxID=2838551 RepID=A0A9D2NKB7_9FIRM|nr:chromate transporter [Candidatus Eisenbergiella merdavium]
MNYLDLFISFFQIGLLSFGGGMAAIPLIQEQVVAGHGWLSMTEFTDLITIAEMTPGPITINSSTFVGLRTAGIPGAVVATAGCVLPSCLIVLVLARLYFKYGNLAYIQGTLSGLRPAIVALIASAGLSILCMAVWNQEGISLHPADADPVAVLLFLLAFLILRRGKTNPIFIMLGCGVVGGILYTLTGGAL